ncbi:MAG: hypothetical protein Q8Q60_02500 [Candidatus Chromulinivorax sp.]|nr:hypothetical protein [Candidatus Chromulinivorax sp.]
MQFLKITLAISLSIITIQMHASENDHNKKHHSSNLFNVQLRKTENYYSPGYWKIMDHAPEYIMPCGSKIINDGIAYINQKPESSCNQITGHGYILLGLVTEVLTWTNVKTALECDNNEKNN